MESAYWTNYHCLCLAKSYAYGKQSSGFLDDEEASGGYASYWSQGATSYLAERIPEEEDEDEEDDEEYEYEDEDDEDDDEDEEEEGSNESMSDSRTRQKLGTAS